MQQPQRGQHLAEQIGNFRMFRQVLLDGRPLAAIETLRELAGHLAHQGLHRGAARHGLNAHRWAPSRPLASSSLRSRSNARP